MTEDPDTRDEPAGLHTTGIGEQFLGRQRDTERVTGKRGWWSQVCGEKTCRRIAMGHKAAVCSHGDPREMWVEKGEQLLIQDDEMSSK